MAVTTTAPVGPLTRRYTSAGAVVGLFDAAGNEIETGGGSATVTDVLEAALPAASADNLGTEYQITDRRGGCRVKSNGTTWVEQAPAINDVDGIPAVAWASRSTATLRLIKAMTDAGSGANALWSGDGAVYRPLNGGALAYMRNGTVASPFATYTGGTGGLFTGAQVVFPAASIPSHSRLTVVTFVKRTGANGTANIRVYLGTAGTTGDSVLGQLALSATDGHVGKLTCEGLFGTSTTAFVSSGALAPMNSAGTSTFADQSTNINTASAMTLSIGMSNANALDSFALLGFAIWLEA